MKQKAAMRWNTTALCFGWLTGLAIIQDGLRRGFTEFKLRGHFLDLRCVFLEHVSHGCVLLLLLRHSFLQRFHFAVLFQKLVEQHRVHRLIANAVNFSLSVTNYEIGVDLFHILSHKAELWNAL